MKKNLLWLIFSIIFLGGFFTYFSYEQQKPTRAVKKDRSFVVIVPFSNQEKTLPQILDSITSQTYTNYRMVLIDDGSTDESQTTIDNYLQEKNLSAKIIHRQENEGPIKRFYETSFNCEDDEILLLLDQEKIFESTTSLETLNALFREKDLQMVIAGKSYEKPHFFTNKHSKTSYLLENGLYAFSASLFRKVPIEHFFYDGDFLQKGQESAFLIPMIKLAKKNLFFHYPHFLTKLYNPKEFTIHKKHPPIPTAAKRKTQYITKDLTDFSAQADLIVFSFDRPLQLYSLLESAHENLENIDQLTVIYRSSNSRFTLAYEELKTHFPDVNFIQQSSIPEKDFKPLLEDALFDKKKTSPYILFAVDDLLFTDKVDLGKCAEMMEKTNAYFFSLRLGKNITYCYMGDKPQQIPLYAQLPDDILAWHVAYAEGDWAFFHSVDATIYRKKDLKKIIPRIQYKTPNTLEGWLNLTKKDHVAQKNKRIGLCFASAKTVNIPLNLVNGSDNKNMNLFSTDELVEKFEKRKKIDLETVKKVIPDKVHMEIEPKFISRKKKDRFIFNEEAFEEQTK